MAEAGNGAAAPANLSKLQAVRESLGRLGKGAMPAAVVADVKQRHQMDVRRKYVSAIKAEIRGGAKKPAAKKRKGVPAAPAPAAAPAPKSAPGIRLEDIVAVQALVGRVGAEQLHALIRVFAR